MARFIGYVEGNRGEASRLGSADSGIRAQAQGWNVGVKVYGMDANGRDEFRVYATNGSTGGAPDTFIGVVRLNEAGRPTFESGDDPRKIIEALHAYGAAKFGDEWWPGNASEWVDADTAAVLNRD